MEMITNLTSKTFPGVRNALPPSARSLKPGLFRRQTTLAIFIVATVAVMPCSSRAAQAGTNMFRSQFFELCDAASAVLKLSDPASTNPVPGKTQPAFFTQRPFFIQSYPVRALCAAYDLTGKESYLEACRVWSERMAAMQDDMIPRGAYYMNYGREPGQTNGGWYVADSASIAMGVLATAVRCEGAEKERLLNSVKSFTALVLDNYVGKGGGIQNGIWYAYDGEWWCSSGIFGSLLFLLHDETGDERYLQAGLGVVDWLNHFDPNNALPANRPIYQLPSMGPTMTFYVLETYSAALPHLKEGSPLRKGALAQIGWTLDWTAEQQGKPLLERKWMAGQHWGMKFGGLPFHQYVYARQLPGREKLLAAADREMQQLAPLVFAVDFKMTQLPAFMMMSYAERLAPGAIYRSSKSPVRADKTRPEAR